MRGSARGQIAVVTGASSGIGAAVARALVRQGAARVVLVARREARLHALAAELGPVASVHPADLADPAQIDQLIAAWPQVDILVNNAGFGWGRAFADQLHDPTRLLRMTDVNCRAVVQLTAGWLPAMRTRGRGWILNVGSVAGIVPTPGMAVYSASKAYMNSFSEALRHELRGSGVEVCLLAPGPVDTEFFHVARPGTARPSARLFRDADTVANEALDCLFRGRPALVPGRLIRAGFGVLGNLPAPLLRPLMGAVVALNRRFSSPPSPESS